MTARSGVAIGEGEMVEVEVEGVVDVVEGREVILGKLWQPFVQERYFRFVETFKV